MCMNGVDVFERACIHTFSDVSAGAHHFRCFWTFSEFRNFRFSDFGISDFGSNGSVRFVRLVGRDAWVSRGP